MKILIMQLFRISILIILINDQNRNSLDACTNFIVTKGASKDGSNMITYAADAGGFMEPLKFFQAAEHKPGSLLDIYDWDSGKFLGQIPQAPKTYKVVGNINEFQLSIAETTFGGVDSLRDSTGLIDYGSMMYIVLQRAKTAQEAITLMDTLFNKYGYFSSGESFSIADPNEVWIMEVIGKGAGSKGVVWAAMRIPDGYIAAHANQSRIRNLIMNDTKNCRYSKDVITFAKSKNIYKEYKGEFSFADTYNPLDPGSLLYCEGRVWRFYSLAAPNLKLSDDYFRAVEGADPYPLFIKPDNKIGVKDLQNWMRDHFEGTEYDMTKGLGAGPHGCPYRWKGLEWKIDGDTISTYGWERPISTQQTAFSFVMQLRSWMPNHIGGLMWYGVDDAASTCYIPLYCSMVEVPKAFVGGSIAEFDWNNGFWIFNLVANRAYTNYKNVIKDINKVQASFEERFLAYQPALENAALELDKQNKDLAIDFLSDYSINNTMKVMDTWKDLWQHITVKYNDGYINDVKKNNGRSPKGAGYNNDFLKKVLEERPGYYDVKWKKKTGNVN
jgi:dipeptidase